MRPLRLLLAALLATASLHAQAPAMPPPVPTTHVLAIGHLTVTRDKIAPIMQQEVRDTIRLYLAGKIENWYFRTDGKGVVFIINATTIEEAHALLEKLPLGQAHAMEFDLIALGPLSPLNILLADKPAAVPTPSPAK